MKGMNNMEKKKFEGWYQLIIVSSIMGLIANFMNNSVTIANTIMMTSGGIAISATAFGLGSSIYSLMQGIPQPLVGKLVKKKGSRLILTFGCILAFVLGIGLSNLINSDISYLIIYGVVWGAVYMISSQIAGQSLINNWFRLRRGQAQSITLAINTVFAIIAPPVANWFIKTIGGGNFKYGWYFGAAFSIIALILTFFLKDRPEDYGQYPDGISSGETIEAKSISSISTVYKRPAGEDISLKEAFKMPIFWLMIIGGSLGFVTITILFIIPVHFREIGFSMDAISVAISVRSIFRLIMILFVAKIIDKKEPALLWGLYYLVYGLTLLIFGNATETWQMFLVLMINFGVGAFNLAVTPTIYANYFGNKHFPEIQGFALLIGGLLSSTTGLISGMIRDTTGSYLGAFYLYGVLALVGFLVFVFGVGIPTSKKYKMEVASNNK